MRKSCCWFETTRWSVLRAFWHEDTRIERYLQHGNVYRALEQTSILKSVWNYSVKGHLFILKISLFVAQHQNKNVLVWLSLSTWMKYMVVLKGAKTHIIKIKHIFIVCPYLRESRSLQWLKWIWSEQGHPLRLLSFLGRLWSANRIVSERSLHLFSSEVSRPPAMHSLEFTRCVI